MGNFGANGGFVSVLLTHLFLYYFNLFLESNIGIHASWVVTLFCRLSIHESLLVRRWAVLTVLTLDYSSYPMILQDTGSKVPDIVKITTVLSASLCVCDNKRAKPCRYTKDYYYHYYYKC